VDASTPYRRPKSLDVPVGVVKRDIVQVEHIELHRLRAQLARRLEQGAVV